MIPIKVYDSMNNSNFDNVNFYYVFKFTFVCNPKELQMSQSKQSPYSCFHPTDDIQIKLDAIKQVLKERVQKYY
jgi:hypothetical protein